MILEAVHRIMKHIHNPKSLQSEGLNVGMMAHMIRPVRPTLQLMRDNGVMMT